MGNSGNDEDKWNDGENWNSLTSEIETERREREKEREEISVKYYPLLYHGILHSGMIYEE